MAKTINKLVAKEMFQLAEFVRAEYANAGQTDVVFAIRATEKLGFQVTAPNVAGAREIFGIPSTAAAVRAAHPEGTRSVKVPGAVYERLRNLEQQVAELMAFKKSLEN